MHVRILSRIDQLPFEEPNPLADGHNRTNYGWFPPYYEYVRWLLEQSYVRRLTEDNVSIYTVQNLREVLDPEDIGFYCPDIWEYSQE